MTTDRRRPEADAESSQLCDTSLHRVSVMSDQAKPKSREATYRVADHALLAIFILVIICIALGYI